jgi:hypothetical protein
MQLFSIFGQQFQKLQHAQAEITTKTTSEVISTADTNDQAVGNTFHAA